LSKLRKPRRKSHPVLVTLLLMLIQLGVLIYAYILFAGFTQFLAFGWTIFALVLIVFIINREENPGYQIAWIIPMCLFPLFGILLYIYVQVLPGTRAMAKEHAKSVERTAPFLVFNRDVLRRLRSIDGPFGSLAMYMGKRGPHPLYLSGDNEYLASGEDAFESIFEALESAKEFIFIEFFIMSEGELMDRALKILAEKAASGVEVRFLYDGTTSYRLPVGFDQYLTSLGIRVHIFSPVIPLLSTYQNNRDHRKIIVVDGKVAFTGGINLADEYVNIKELYGHWKDAAIRVEGEAVNSFTLLFLQMWNMQRPDDEDVLVYLRKYDQLPKSDSFIIPYADAPYDGESMAENVYLHILYQAQKYVHIMSPYFIPSHDILTAITFAAKRGVDVKLILPRIPDKRIPFYVARGYYPQLIRAGVKIYEYLPGFTHSKVFVSDDKVSTVGSVNLDYRSLYLHYEVGALVYEKEMSLKVEADILSTLRESERIYMEDYRSFHLFTRLIGKVMRIFGPLL
jgi:cardiolipin synthase